MTAMMREIPPKDFLHVRFPAPVLDALRQLAADEGCTVAAITRRLVKEELRRNDKTVTITINLV